MFIFILISCKKDKKDTQPPVITFTSPGAGQAFGFVLDSVSGKYHLPIRVTAGVSDNVHLSLVYVTLTDMNHTPVQNSDKVPVTSASFTVDIVYDVTEFRLQTGAYLIQITADDGYNTVSSFQPITITESPTLWLGYCINLKSSPLAISRYDSLKSQSLLPVSLTSYNGMKYGGYNQQLYINGSGTSQPFLSYNLGYNLTDYTEGLTGTQSDYSCLFTDGARAYVGFKNGITQGTIYSYSNLGVAGTSYRYTGSSVSYPYYFTTTSTNNVAVFKNISVPGSDHIVTFTSAGATYNSTFLPVNMKSVTAILEKSQDSLYVFGNDVNNQAITYIYQPQENSFLPSSITGTVTGKLLSAVAVNNEYVIFSTTTGVYACRGLTINSAPLLTDVVQKLAYQPKLNMLVAATMGNLNAYTVNANSLSSLISKRSLSMPADSIVDFEVITNK